MEAAEHLTVNHRHDSTAYDGDGNTECTCVWSCRWAYRQEASEEAGRYDFAHTVPARILCESSGWSNRDGGSGPRLAHEEEAAAPAYFSLDYDLYIDACAQTPSNSLFYKHCSCWNLASLCVSRCTENWKGG